MKKRVFISYAWEEQTEADKKVKAFVDGLAIFLKTFDLDVLLDRYENHPGSNLDKFMSEGIDSSNFVICVCTETYIKKMKNQNSGVYNEITLLSKMSDSPFIIPIIEIGYFIDLPEFFKGKFVSQLFLNDFRSPENKSPLYELINTLMGKNLSIKDVVPKIRIENYYESSKDLQLYGDVTELMRFENEMEKTVYFQYSLDEGKIDIGIPPMNFATEWTERDESSIYVYKNVQKMFYINNFKNFEEVHSPGYLNENRDDLMSIKRVTDLVVGDGIVWINDSNHVAIGKILDIKFSRERENRSKNIVTFKYRILNPIDLTEDFKEE
ncbi:toll/interleukin-1 receptor domain-containing protein [Streptococcaceae bacterium ESL0687]|nr:toll/interleukin-1 receptor domain-containing protein [Streptococcaceae bacterium ESL0687]